MQRVSDPPAIPTRPRGGHKGTFGRVLIVGGQAGMIGAPALAGRAALRLGAGLVQIAVPQEILSAALMVTPELIGIGLKPTPSTHELTDAVDQADSLVIGPGLGQSKAAEARVLTLMKSNKPAVVDADALNILAKQSRWPKSFKALAVLTPHPGEMLRLAKLLGRDEVPSDEPGRIEIAVQAAQVFGQVIVLKGMGTVVTDGNRVYVNRSGDSSLAKAGTGDVLSGMLGTLLAQAMPPFEAACAVVHLHGRAGEIAGQRLGLRCVLSHEVVEVLPQAIAEHEQAFGTAEYPVPS